MPRGIEVTGTLHVTIDDHAIELRAEGNRIRAEVGDVPRDFVRPSLRLAASSFVLARRLSRSLDRTSLTLEFTRDGRTVVELGAGVRGGRLARFLGLSRVRVVRSA